MAHSKQAKKRDRQNERRRLHNKGIASTMRSAVKKVITAVDAGDLDAARAAVPFAMKRIDKAAKTNVIHANCASRKKSMILRAIGRAEAS